MSYTITVPDKPEALRAAAEFFSRLAGVTVGIDLGTSDRSVSGIVNRPTGAQVETTNHRYVSSEIVKMMKNPTQTALIGDAPVPNVVSFIPAPSVPDALAVAPESPVPPVVSTVEEPAAVVPDAAGVFGASPQPATPAPSADIDANGLPWDGRIHASTRTKIADGSWKKRKRPAEQYSEPEWAGYIGNIEQELRSVMALPAVSVTPAPGFVHASIPCDVPVPVAPAAPAPTHAAPAPGTIVSFAQLNVAITSNAIPFERVTEAINQVGLQAYPLLAARPDLVPAVAAILFP